MPDEDVDIDLDEDLKGAGAGPGPGPELYRVLTGRVGTKQVQLAGELLVNVREIKHATCARQGYDILIEQEYTLFDALFGSTFLLQHPSKDHKAFDVDLGDLIALHPLQQGQRIRLARKGIPRGPFAARGNNGYLYLVVGNIKMPLQLNLSLDRQKRGRLEKVLAELDYPTEDEYIRILETRMSLADSDSQSHSHSH